MKALALAALLVAAGRAAAAPPAPGVCGPAAWPHWTRYVEVFVAADGRVIDHTAEGRSTSEGQAYAMFLALVAGDRALFERLLRWTTDNLARGDLARHLPAWKWGADASRRWGVLDPNSASDADLWLAYALLEAGRLWSEPRYEALARAVLANVAAREVADLPGLGPTLLPAPVGFVLPRGRGWRLNPSYVPPQLLRRLASAGVPGPWQAVLASGLRVVREGARSGAVPDWILYAARRGFAADPVRGAVGSYDAIRTYLWIGMLAADDPARPHLAAAVAAPLRMLERRGALPERIDVRTLRARGSAPPGFYAALLPLATTTGADAAARAIEERLGAALHAGLYGEPATYYDQNLALFGRGFAEGRFRFGADGRLATSWEEPCAASRR